MQDSHEFERLVKLKKVPKRRAGEKLGVSLGRLLNGVNRQQKKFGSVVELFEDILPIDLRKHCKLADTRNGELKIIVDSPAHRQELQWCADALIEEINKRSPRARISRIKTTIGSIK